MSFRLVVVAAALTALPALGCGGGGNGAGGADAGASAIGDAGLLTEVAKLPTPCVPTSSMGLAVADGHLWVGCGWSLFELDKASGDVLKTHSSYENFISEDKFDGLTFAEGRFWNVGTWLDKVVHFKSHPPVKGGYDFWSSQSANAGTLAWDGAALWSVTWETAPKNTHYIFSYRMSDMTVDQKIEQPGIDDKGYGITGLAWDSGRKRMWSSGYDYGANSLVVVRHRADAALSWEVSAKVSPVPTGLVFDGADLWVGFKYDTGENGFIRRYRVNL